MKGEKHSIYTTYWLRNLICVSLLFVFHLPYLNRIHAQESVAPCTGWLATVDEVTQQIVLSWHPSPDSDVMGYHICTGIPCIDYDTVFGRLDTSYICLDHNPLEQHTYRLHVFDSAYNVSALTPSFGNMVLTADIPECESTVTASWTPYEGMPDGVFDYRLMIRIEPYDSIYLEDYATSADGTLSYSFELPEGATIVSIKVLARNTTGHLVSQSNVVRVERMTVDSASCNDITSIIFDTLQTAIKLNLQVDTAFVHTLWRSIDGTPWHEIATIQSTTQTLVFTDTDINRFDSLHCYQLSVSDACGLNERFSPTVCIVVPNPPKPNIAIPNIIIVGNERNGAFRPNAVSLMGDLYELYIYNRNGALVFSSKDPTAEWRPGTETEQGAYTYYLRCRFSNNRIHTYAGTFLVIR